jgi:RimJ/RimL family protein N-acetyltransferase
VTDAHTPTPSPPIGPEIDAAPARRPVPGTRLIGRDVALVPLDPIRHGPTLYRHAHGPEQDALWLYLAPSPFADEASFTAYLERSAASSDPFFLAILDPDGACVGHATFMRIDAPNRVIEVGNILLTPPLQRTRGATEAMYLMARHAFEDLGYRRYEWKCNALNAPSRRAAERLGFTFEGLFRQHMIVKGRSRDTAWYSMLERNGRTAKPPSSAGSIRAISTRRDARRSTLRVSGRRRGDEGWRGASRARSRS